MPSAGSSAAQADHASALLQTSNAVADAFRSGATLRPVGVGVSAVDADHVSVEFVHPVITGKRALPAVSLDAAGTAGVRAGDVVLALGPDDATCSVAATVRATPDAPAVWIGADDEAAVPARHVALPAGDRLTRRAHLVTAYHLLWELVHEVLDAAQATTDDAPADLRSLYPFLYRRDPGDVDGGLLETTTAKLHDIDELRARVIDELDETITRAAGVIGACGARGGTVWTFGNGGSSTDARALAHLLAEPGTGERVDARALVDDVATITALANDVAFDVVFARMLRSLARPGDVAVGLSTSGGSSNVLAGLDAARDLDLRTIGFAGYDGGALADLDALDELLVVPSSSVHRIQEAQTTLLHALVRRSRAL